MKIKGLIVFTGVIGLMLGSCAQSPFKNAKLTNKQDSLSYAFGIVNYNALTTDSLMLDPMIVAKAMIAGKGGNQLMADEIARSLLWILLINVKQRKLKNKQNLIR